MTPSTLVGFTALTQALAEADSCEEVIGIYLWFYAKSDFIVISGNEIWSDIIRELLSEDGPEKR